MKYFRVVVFLGVMIFLAGCGGNTPLNTANLNPSTLTVRFNVIGSSNWDNFESSTDVADGIVMLNTRGDGLEPNFYMTLTRYNIGYQDTSEILFRDGNLYQRNAYNNRWLPFSTSTPHGILGLVQIANFAIPLNGTNLGLNLTNDMNDWQFIADETVNGFNTKRYTRQFDASTTPFWSFLREYLPDDNLQITYNIWLVDGRPQQFTALIDSENTNNSLMSFNLEIVMIFDYQSLINIPAPQ